MCSKKNICSLLLALFMLLMLVAVTIFPSYAADKNCTLTLICSNNSKPVANIEWSIYKIGSRNSSRGFSLGGDFKEYPISLDDMSASAVQKDAYTLENYAKLDDVSVSAKGKSDQQGRVVFKNLEAGIYLICGDEYSTSTYKYTPSPSIVEVCVNAETNNNTIVYPKFSVKEIPINKKVFYSVRKIWANDEDDLSARPKEILVELYADESLNRTVTLNDSNGWYYEWESEDTISWRVKENTVDKNYTVNVGKNDTEFLIVNTYKTTTETTSNTTVTETVTKSSTKTKTITTGPTETVTTVTTTLPPREELRKRIKEYEDFPEDDYTPSSWKKFRDVLERAKRTLSYIDSTDESIKKALEELENAKNNLVLAYEPWLPQTGQLWWPVPVLAGAGLVLIAVGIRIIAKKGNKDEKE